MQLFTRITLNKTQIKFSSHILRDFIELTRLTIVPSYPLSAISQAITLCGISHNGLPGVTVGISMQGIHCVFATHLVDRKNDNSWLTSILWIYTVVDSYNPSHIAGISLATHESCIRTNKYWNSWGILRMRCLKIRTPSIVLKNIKFDHDFLPSFRVLLNLLTIVA